MEKIWTPSQQDAIDARGTSLAVSAAAGSGKTAVLTQRIINLLSQEEIDPAKLVVVTFTKAAAAELEDRLYDGLSEKIATLTGEEKRKLSHTLLRLSLAQISTIHSFAFSLIKEHRRNLGLGEKIRIADEAESTILLKKAVDEALGEYLKQEENKAAGKALFSLFAGPRRPEELANTVVRMINVSSSYPGGLLLIEEKIKERREELLSLKEGSLSLGQTLFGKEMLTYAKRRLTSSILVLDEVIAIAENSALLGEKLLPRFSDVKAALFSARAALDGADLKGAKDCIDEAFSKHFPSFRKLEGEEIFLKDQIKEVYGEKVKKIPQNLAKEVLDTDLATIVSEGLESLEHTENLLSIAKTAKELFAEEKREKGVVDYADLEEMCLTLFAQKEGDTYVKTPLAEEVSRRFQAIFVDEYQDTNAIQDTIFRALAPEGRLFVVGDPKQSIYRFRGAAPEIFSDYKKNLPLYPTQGKTMQKILLSENFRCDKPIIDLVNRLFAFIMDENDPDSLYREEDRLRFSKEKKEGEKEFSAELVLVEKDLNEGDEDTGLTKEENRESAYLAGRITEMLSEEELAPGIPLQPKDIGVICRTHAQIAHVKESLEKRGIPCNAEVPAGITEDPEYLFMTSLLSTLDNPTCDIPLLGTLLSPVFRFSPDALYRIRLGGKGLSFLSAMERFAKEGDHPQTRALCIEALAALKEMREKSAEESLFAFLFHLYETFAIEELFASGEKTVPTKEILLSAAESAYAAGIHTVGGFCRYLNETEMKFSEGEDGVKLMTVHKSKGLQIPVVFVSFLARPFSLGDERQNLIMDGKLGAFSYIPRLNGRAKVDPFLRNCAKKRIHREGLEEAKRVLYVALTRAQRRLILTAAPDRPDRLFASHLLFSPKTMDRRLAPYLTEEASSLLDFVLPALQGSDALRDIFLGKEESAEETLVFRRATPPPFALWQREENEEKELSFDPEETLAALDFTYEKTFLETLPKKLSVSQILKENREEEAAPEFYPRRLLDFEKGTLLSGAEVIGTATHQVMQYTDFEKMAQDPEGEWRRLKEKGFLSEEDLELVDKEAVTAFFRSDLYQKMKNSPCVEHEKRFNVFLPAKTLGLGEEGEVLVQGVVDAWFENPDGTLTLLDFKTDRVKGEKSESVLLARHKDQLLLYKEAVRALTGKEISALYLYSFSLGREILVPTNE